MMIDLIEKPSLDQQIEDLLDSLPEGEDPTLMQDAIPIAYDEDEIAW